MNGKELLIPQYVASRGTKVELVWGTTIEISKVRLTVRKASSVRKVYVMYFDNLDNGKFVPLATRKHLMGGNGMATLLESRVEFEASQQDEKSKARLSQIQTATFARRTSSIRVATDESVPFTIGVQVCCLKACDSCLRPKYDQLRGEYEKPKNSGEPLGVVEPDMSKQKYNADQELHQEQNRRQGDGEGERTRRGRSVGLKVGPATPVRVARVGNNTTPHNAIRERNARLSQDVPQERHVEQYMSTYTVLLVRRLLLGLVAVAVDRHSSDPIYTDISARRPRHPQCVD
ncbi:hypothetical protein K474DRAFT_1678547 [Panus rudis PR-1116 ss-1]|nr:hypothetical protein K474DRAFT_1678547 [Panus rudis PR-1116 ss-1]